MTERREMKKNFCERIYAPTHVAERTLQEVADILSLPRSTVVCIEQRALRKLRAALKRETRAGNGILDGDSFAIDI